VTLPPGVTIRGAVPDDAEAGARLHVACWREAYGPHVDPEVLEDRLADSGRWVEAWRHQLAEGPPRVVAEAHGELVGFAVAGPSRDEDAGSAAQEIYAIYARAAWWGTGLGQELLDRVLPVESCSLWVLEANARAQAFYRRNGFEPDGAREHYAGLDAWELRMVRR
jgi:ribosomal protein S18 acetylase RimI-like enzyme